MVKHCIETSDESGSVYFWIKIIQFIPDFFRAKFETRRYCILTSNATFPRGRISSVKMSNSRPFFINTMVSQEWAKTFPFKNVQSCFPQNYVIWCLGCWQILPRQVVKYNGLLHHFNLRLQACSFSLSVESNLKCSYDTPLHWQQQFYPL